MNDKTKQEIVEGTLQWCNSMRALDGKPALKKLPKGHRHDENSCPCGKATGLQVYNTFWEKDGKFGGNVPDIITTFTTDFDDRLFPEYDIEVEAIL